MHTDGLKIWWEKWDIQVVVTASLLLQVYLILFAPLRKRMSKWYITMPMWLAYLLADAAATYAVGLISKSQIQGKRPLNADLLVFWAPFLLVHLGGPDPITAFALEDNELWLRHALSLVVQSSAVAYAFYLSFQQSGKLWLPSVLMFLVGLIKYTERTRSLYLASMRRFRESLLTKPDPGPNYAKLMDEYSSKIEAGLPTRIDLIPEPNRVIKIENKEEYLPLTDLQIVQRGYRYFMTFKGLIVDLIFSFRERSVVREYFLKRSSRDAFKIVEVELNFIYEILYTKVTVVQGTYGYPLRVLSFGLSCAALLLFHSADKPKGRYDIVLTYTLLGGALALDTVAFFMVLFSDWTAVALSEPEGRYDGENFFEKRFSDLKKFLSGPLRIERDRWPKETEDEKKRQKEKEEKAKERKCGFNPYEWIMTIVRRRWSETICQYNLVDYCLRPRPSKIEFVIDLFGLKNMFDSIKYVTTKDFTIVIRDLIFDELRMKSDMAEDLDTAKEIFAARGDWVLRFESCTKLLPWIDSVDYDESILLWHIATELQYNTDGVGADEPQQSGSNHLTEENFKWFSKLISDYMLYLLIMQTTMLSTVAGIGQIRYLDTCAETKKFFRGRNIGKGTSMNCFSKLFGCCFPRRDLETGEKKPRTSCFKSLLNFFGYGKKERIAKQAEIHKIGCERILAVTTAVKPVAVKGDRSKSILFDASMLAKELGELGNEIKEANKGEDKLRKGKWEIMCRVWIELMCYAATRCRANTHAAQLSKGGELISLIWLLMAHFGLGNQYQISEGHARAKLVVGK